MNVFAWEGAVAVAGPSEEGMIGSHRFATYTPVDDSVLVDYFSWYFRSQPGLELLRRVSPGSAGRNRTMNLDLFAAEDVPLPPPPHQRQIVAELDSLTSKITAALNLRELAAAEARHMIRSAIGRRLDHLSCDAPLSSILTDKPRNGWSANCDNSDGGVSVLTLSAVTGFQYRPTAFKRTSLPTKEGEHYWLRPDDLLITRSNTPELVGHAAIYTGEPYPCIYPDLMMRLPVDNRKADPRFVWCWLQSPTARDFIKKNAKGTSPTMKKISQGIVMSIPFPSDVSLQEQRRIVAYFDELQAKVESLKKHQTETAAELDAMLPSILNRAFRGEL